MILVKLKFQTIFKVVINPRTTAIGDFTVRRVPDNQREKVAGDEVSAKKRVRASTAESIEGVPVEMRTPRPKKKHPRKK